jgi:hypothetical protein
MSGELAFAAFAVGERPRATASVPAAGPADVGRSDEECPPHAESDNVRPSPDAIARDGIRMCLLQRPKQPERFGIDVDVRTALLGRGAGGGGQRVRSCYESECRLA